jgi:hypothetical protein
MAMTMTMDPGGRIGNATKRTVAFTSDSDVSEGDVDVDVDVDIEKGSVVLGRMVDWPRRCPVVFCHFIFARHADVIVVLVWPLLFFSSLIDSFSPLGVFTFLKMTNNKHPRPSSSIYPGMLIVPDILCRPSPSDLILRGTRFKPQAFKSVRMDLNSSGIGCIKYLPPDWELVIANVDMPDGPQVKYKECQQFDLPRSEGKPAFVNCVHMCWASLIHRNQAIIDALSYAVGGKQGFWEYVKRFPMHWQALPPNAELDFLSSFVLMFLITSPLLRNNFRLQTFPFTDDQTQRLLRIYRDLKGTAVSPLWTMMLPADYSTSGRQTLATDGGNNALHALIWHIAKVMINIESNRTLYQHGTANASIYRNKSIPKPSWKVRAFDLTLTVLLFGAHTMYRKRMESTRPRGQGVPDRASLPSGMSAIRTQGEVSDCTRAWLSRSWSVHIM